MTGQQVLVLYIIVAVGFIADKAKIYTEQASRLTTDLLFYIITPAVIIQSFLSMDRSADNLRSLLIAIACGVGIHVAGIVMSLPLFRSGDARVSPIYKYACIYGNCGYMALPLAQAVLGTSGVFYCSAVIMVFNVFCFSHGVRIMEDRSKKFDFKRLLSGMLINPGTIGVVLGLPLFLLSVKLPYIIDRPLAYIASLNTPLAMLIFGTYLANTDLKSMFTEKRIYGVALFKLVLLPLVTLAAFRLCGVSGALLTAMAISASAPSANNTVLFSAKFDKDTGTASKTVAVVSFLSVLTMPLIIAAAATLN